MSRIARSQVTASGDRSVAADYIGGPVATGDNALFVTIERPQIYAENLNVSSVPAPIARSAYIEQVRQISPAELRDRDDELADLDQFCTSPDAGQYLWWQAEAWSGKSALMSWFVLHPPPGAEIVSFFVTARYAGQDDQTAFIDVVSEQLADMLGQSMPPYMPVALRYAHFLKMLADAAKACRSRGRYLVLVLDGLDEDRGVVAGPEAHSIAALLPASPAEGMRIVIAGRPHPPIPSDVDDNHPLRDPKIVRILKRSPWAEVVKADMQRELGRLLHGTRLQMDLLGLITAAAGGLSARDMAELTQQSVHEIEENLDAVLGRTFISRAPRWQPESESRAYILGHEELQVASRSFLGESRLAEYRSRLHTWADSYRDRRWPPDTPEYLLRGYFRMAHNTRDTLRAVGLATDQERHDRMLDVSGGDTAALAEISDTQNLLIGAGQPDMVAIANLAVYRIYILERNASIPTRLPEIWAQVGNPARAEALARAIANPGRRAEALLRIAKIAASAGDADRFGRLARQAEESVHTIPSREQRAERFVRLAELMATAGYPTRAREVIHLVIDRVLRVEAIARVAYATATGGDLVQARTLAQEAENMASRSRDPSVKAYALTSLTEMAIEVGKPDQVRKLVQKAYRAVDAMPNSIQQMEILARLVNAAVGIGDVERATLIMQDITDQSKHDDALGSVAKAVASACEYKRATATARKIVDEGKRENALISLVREFASTDEFKKSERLISSLRLRRRAEAQAAYALGRMNAGDFEGAEAAALSVAREALRGNTLLELATSAARAGDLTGAEKAAKAIGDPSKRAAAIASVAEEIARKGDLRRARVMVAEAEESASAVVDRDDRQQVLVELVGPIARAADTERARGLAHSIASPRRRSEALTSLAHVAGESGDVALASILAREAEAAARAIVNSEQRVQMLIGLVGAVAIAGDYQRTETLARQALELTRAAIHRSQLLSELAEAVALSANFHYAANIACAIADAAWQSEAVIRLADMAVSAGNIDEARRLAKRAENGVERIALPGRRAEVTAALIKVIAAFGDLDWAEGLMRTISAPERLAEAQIALIAARGAAGELGRAADLITLIDGISRQGEAFINLLESAAETDDKDLYGVLSQRAETLISQIPNTRRRVVLLVRLIQSITAAGEFDRAEKLLRNVTIRDKKAEVVTDLARAVADAGDAERSRALARRAESLILQIRRKGWRGVLLSALARAVTVSGDFYWAEELIQAIPVPDIRAQALLALAGQVENRGESQWPGRLTSQAENIVFAIKKSDWQAQALTELARRSRPDHVLPLLANAMSLGSWAPALGILAGTDPTVIIEIVDNYIENASMAG